MCMTAPPGNPLGWGSGAAGKGEARSVPEKGAEGSALRRADMALFLGRHIHQIDRKGRVSVPAPFRAALSGQLEQGIVAVPSFKLPAVDCYSMEKLEALSQQVDQLRPFPRSATISLPPCSATPSSSRSTGKGASSCPKPSSPMRASARAWPFWVAARPSRSGEPSAADEFLAKAGSRALAERRVLKPDGERQ